MDNELMSLRAQGLIENLSELDADYDVMALLDETMDYIEETKSVYDEAIRRKAKAERIGNTLVGIGLGITLVSATGVDVPDPTANYIACVVGLVIAGIGFLAKK